jgi:O-antigen/teichoic acid export membrane protein
MFSGFKGEIMSKFKLFIENFFVYGLGGVISKIIPLIMIPIITRLMPSTEYYGLSDLSSTVVSFASALAVMGMYDAMYRMFFEKDDEEYKKDICSTALLFTFTMSVIVFVAMLLLKEQIARAFFGNRKYAYLVYLSAVATLVGATNSIISAPTRMQNKRKIFLISNTVSPLISYLVSIPMLLEGYYTIALPLAGVVSAVVMEITFGILNHSWFNPKRFDFALLRQLLVIAVPLLPNFLIYWVFNSCDKVMITNMIGIGAAGVYSVGSKLGHASQLIYTAFAGGWQFYAFSTMKEDNQVKNNSLIFEYLGVISFIATTFICAWSYPIFKLLFTEQYLSGYIVAPYLFLAPLLQMLFQVAGNQFLVIKKTWPNMIILSSGAVVNVVINFSLIPILGIEGASLATLLGYVVSDIVCVVVLYKMKLIVLEKRFILAVLGMAGYYIVWRLFITSNWLVGTLFALVAAVYFIYLYKKELISIARKLRKR